MKSSRGIIILLSLILLLLSTTTIQAQIVIRGTVKKTTSHEPVAGALVLLLNQIDGNRISYQLSDSNGSFALEANVKQTPDVLLAVKLLGFEEYKREIALAKSDIDIDVFLEESNTILNEIVVEQSRISQKGDTINYLALLFKNADDRTLSDLIQRLPGLTVSETGQISYQGEPISKFYIEGLDLLQGKYGLATQNINVDQIASVQVLENHQPLRILKSIEIPTSAAINVKLKKSKLGALFGKSKLGVGFPTKHLFSNELSLMHFAQRMQNVLVLKQDNSGRDIAFELTDQYTDWTPTAPQFLSLTRSYAPIDDRYTRINNLYFGSLNSLFLLDSISTLTINVDYKYDRLTHEEFRDRQVFQSNGELFNLKESSWSRNKENTFSAKINFERNSTKKYLQNRITLQKKSNQWDGKVLANNDVTTLLLNTPSFEISNVLSLINSVEKGGLCLKWNTSYLTTLNHLEVNPISNFLSETLSPRNTAKNPQEANQNLNYSNFTTILRLSKTLRLGKKVTADLFSQVDYYRDVFDSRLLVGVDDVKNGINDIVYTTIPLQVGTTLRYNTHQWFLDLSVPLIYHFSKSMRGDFNTFRFLPKLMVSYRPSMSWDLSAYAAHTDVVPSYKNEINGRLLINNNMLLNSEVTLPKQNTLNLGGRVQFKNIRQALFVNFWANSSSSWVNSLSNTIFEDNAFRFEIVPYHHRTNSYSIGAGVDWYLRSISSKFSVKPQWSILKNKVMTSGQPIDIQDRFFSLLSSMDIVPLDWVKVGFTSKISYAHHQLEGMENRTRYNHTHQCTVSLFPVKGLEVQSKLTYYTWSQIKKQPSNALLGDLSISYKINKRIEVRGEWNNIFNAKRLLVNESIGSDLLTTTFFLRTSEVLFQCIIDF